MKRARTDALFKQFAVVSKCPPVVAGVPRLIGTHDGTFHCDEALGCAMLQMLPEWEGATVVRTRDEAELSKCDIVIDVGAEYDHAARRYDHHQRSFVSTLKEEHDDVEAESRLDFNTKLSACGLVYKHYGLKELLPKLTASMGVPSSLLPILYRKMYKGFVEEVDAIDNGVDIADGELRYKITTNLSARVGQMNPNWNEDGSKETRNGLFAKAMELTAGEFHSTLDRLCSSWWPARSLVEEAMASRKAIDPSGEVLLLEKYCPWQGHLSDLEAEQDVAGLLKYVLFADSNGSWRVQAVAAEGFNSRKALPSPWRGVRDSDLTAITSIDGCVFCHNAGFIGGNKTRQGAIAMARAALAFVEPKVEAAAVPA